MDKENRNVTERSYQNSRGGMYEVCVRERSNNNGINDVVLSRDNLNRAYKR